MNSAVSTLACRVGKIYPKPACVPGKMCASVEGSFCTECEKCDRFTK